MTRKSNTGPWIPKTLVLRQKYQDDEEWMT